MDGLQRIWRDVGASCRPLASRNRSQDTSLMRVGPHGHRLAILSLTMSHSPVGRLGKRFASDKLLEGFQRDFEWHCGVRVLVETCSLLGVQRNF